MIKITGGFFKTKSLETISNFVRPTSSLKREAFFSIIESYSLKNKIDLFENKVFLDLFAGIGTMGLEAISRGMNKAIFYENNIEVIKVLEKNCKKLCKIDQYTIINEDINGSEINQDFQYISMVYIDPPYSKYDIGNLLNILQNKISKNCIIGIETSVNDQYVIPNRLKSIKNKKYGKTNINFLILS